MAVLLYVCSAAEDLPKC